MPVFGAGGTVVAALELGVRDLRTDLESARSALTVATGSLSREPATTGDRVTAQEPARTPATSSGASPVAYHS